MALQGHASYSLPRRSWLAINSTWFGGGETRVDGVPNPDLQRNTRVGATLSIPIVGQQSNQVRLQHRNDNAPRLGLQHVHRHMAARDVLTRPARISEALLPVIDSTTSRQRMRLGVLSVAVWPRAAVPPSVDEYQNIVFEFADSFGTRCSTSQCSTILPASSNRKMSIPAHSPSLGQYW